MISNNRYVTFDPSPGIYVVRPDASSVVTKFGERSLYHGGERPIYTISLNDLC